jgi:protein-tyrosine phosphatase
VVLPDLTSLVDIHNHLVPGVDDGVRSVAGAVEAVERMVLDGIRRVVTTPHLEGSLTLDRHRLEARLDAVSRAWEAAAEAIADSLPEVEFRRGHEVLLDIPNADLSDPRMRLAGTSFVLVEWPRLQIPPGTVPVIERIVASGFRPIIAHPERYHGMAAAFHLTEQWRSAGAFLQVNYGSLAGRFGMDAQTTALRILRKGYADYMASDFHGHARIKLYKREAWSALEELGAQDALGYLCRTNPARILTDELPLPVPPVPVERSLWARLKGALPKAPA